MNQLNEWLSGVDRSQIIRWTAIYLVIYAVVNACGGLVLGLVGALAAGASALVSTSSSTDAATVATVGGLSIFLAICYLISVPIFAVAAFGLFRRKTWARMAAVIALCVSVLLSVINLGNGIGGIIWILISAFGIYLFWSDAGIKQELSQ